MRQSWRSLLFLHWKVPVEQLRDKIPPSLEIDTYEGQAYVGLVPFTMTGVRPVWSPSVAGLSSFHETNVRTYVHLEGRLPGVWFFSLDAASAIAVKIARIQWSLPYFYARMRLEAQGVPQNPVSGDAGLKIDYSSERLWPEPVPAHCRVSYSPMGQTAAATPGTLDHFLLERYLLYTERRGILLSGHVHHSPYPAQPAVVHDLTETLTRAAGIETGDAPPLAHYARGVDVDIFPLRPVVAGATAPRNAP